MNFEVDVFVIFMISATLFLIGSLIWICSVTFEITCMDKDKVVMLIATVYTLGSIGYFCRAILSAPKS